MLMIFKAHVSQSVFLNDVGVALSYANAWVVIQIIPPHLVTIAMYMYVLLRVHEHRQ